MFIVCNFYITRRLFCVQYMVSQSIQKERNTLICTNSIILIISRKLYMDGYSLVHKDKSRTIFTEYKKMVLDMYLHNIESQLFLEQFI